MATRGALWNPSIKGTRSGPLGRGPLYQAQRRADPGAGARWQRGARNRNQPPRRALRPIASRLPDRARVRQTTPRSMRISPSLFPLRTWVSRASSSSGAATAPCSTSTDPSKGCTPQLSCMSFSPRDAEKPRIDERSGRRSQHVGNRGRRESLDQANHPAGVGGRDAAARRSAWSRAISASISFAGQSSVRDAGRETDRRQPCVRLDGAHAPIRVDVEPERGRVQGADRASVRDDECPPPLVSPRDAEHGSDHSFGHLLVGLAVVPAREALPPARDSLREALLRLGAGQPRPRADVHLAQLRKLGHLEPLRPRDLGGRVGRTLQVARVHRVELDAASNAPRAPAPAGDPSRSTGGRRAPASGERRSSRSPRAARAG